MCGRFAFNALLSEIQDQFNIWNDIEETYEKEVFSPTDPIAVIIPKEEKKNKITVMRWGLIPNFIKDFSTIKKYSMFNARSESLKEKASFKNLLNSNRCLIPATSFFEFKQEKKRKDMYEFTVNKNSPFAMAGLWDQWVNPKTKEIIYSCTILTTVANEIVRPIHENNRMPVILGKASYEEWLNPSIPFSKSQNLLRPFPESEMKAKIILPNTNKLPPVEKMPSLFT